MADLANVMKQGQAESAGAGAQLSAQGAGLSQQASSITNNKIKMQAAQVAQQNRIDEIGNVYVEGGVQIKKAVSAAKKNLQDATESGDPDMISKAQKVLDGERVKQGNYIMQISRNPAAVGTLNKMSMADEDLQSLLFDEESVQYLEPGEKEEFFNRWTLYGELERQQQEKRVDDAVQLKGRIKGAETEAMLDAFVEKDIPYRQGTTPKVDSQYKNVGINMANALKAVGDLPEGVTAASIGTMIGNMNPEQVQSEAADLNMLIDNVKAGGVVTLPGSADEYDLSTGMGRRAYVLRYSELAQQAGDFATTSGFRPILDTLLNFADEDDLSGWDKFKLALTPKMLEPKTPLSKLQTPGG